MEEKKKQSALQIDRKATVISGVLVGIMLVMAVALTVTLQPGTLVMAGDGSYSLVPAENGMTWWKYLLSPFIVLTPMYENCATCWSILLLVLVIGAVFSALDECGILVYMVEDLARKFGHRKYDLLLILSFVMMALGTTLGISEEVIPLVPVVVMLFYALGWDSPLALMASDLAACAGFTVGVINPFNTGLAQSLSDEITMYSGVAYRLILFFLFYAVLAFFLIRYAKKIDADPASSVTYEEDCRRKEGFGFDIGSLQTDPAKDRALKVFIRVIGGVLILALCFIFSCTVLSQAAEAGGPRAEQCASAADILSGSILYMMILGYTVAGIGACVCCGLRGKKLWKKMGEGLTTLIPAAFLVLLASAIGYIFDTSGVADTIVYMAARSMERTSGAACVLLLFAFLFLLEIFIPSASGKALLIMPMVYRLCTILGIDHQLAVLAFLFADGFANSLLPSNSGLLITLGLTPVSYPKWMKTAGAVFAVFLLLACGAMVYGYCFVY